MFNVVYLADNGITIKACDDANVGDTGMIDGVTYTVVDEAMLRTMVANEEDVTKVVTTKVTDMIVMLSYSEAFNQNLSSWDVSNVTDMTAMFYNAIAFNQNLSSWSVDGVTECNNFSYDTPQWTLPKPNFTNCTP